ncbi:MAG TPA: AraC family transcriptional regulator [Thermoanaerobaculia bacterium]|nr:AraC family transcriptional regulator [Thermoanaerobaculia bacterium]
MDPISDVFTSFRVQNVVYGRLELTAPWGLAFPEGHALFGMVARGGCWLSTDSLETPISLSGGDCFLLPRGARYEIRDQPRGRTRLITEVGRRDDGTPIPRFQYGGGGAMTLMIAGCFTFDAPATKPVLDLLPSLIHIRADEPQSASLQSTLRLLCSESEAADLGSRIVINRLVDVFFVQAVRYYMANHSACNSKWLRAVADPQIGTALRAVHEAIESPWTVEELARIAGMSRAAFALRFKQLAGEAPLEYVTRWRMYKASQLLKDRGRKLVQIANEVGYETDGAFNRAFKRILGVTPGEFRRNAGAQPAP